MLRALVRRDVKQMLAIGNSSIACPAAEFSSMARHSRAKGSGGAPTLRQKRIASEVRGVISKALQQGPCQNPLLQRCGFEIQDVKMSSDLRTAFVLWRALPGMQKSSERAILAQVARLRSLVFSQLSISFSPVIKFREDRPNLQVQALDEAFKRLKEMEGDSLCDPPESQGEGESEIAANFQSGRETLEEHELQSKTLHTK